MKTVVKLRHWQTFLKTVIGVGVVVMLVMFINLNSAVAKNTASTNHIVKSQAEILDAIKKLAVDTKLNNEQKTTTIICMLQVPIEKRTTDVLKSCRENAEAGGNGITPVIKRTQATQSPQPTKDTISPATPHNSTPTPQNRSTIQTITNNVSNFVKGLL